MDLILITSQVVHLVIVCQCPGLITRTNVCKYYQFLRSIQMKQWCIVVTNRKSGIRKNFCGNFYQFLRNILTAILPSEILQCFSHGIAESLSVNYSVSFEGMCIMKTIALKISSKNPVTIGWNMKKQKIQTRRKWFYHFFLSWNKNKLE